MKKNLILAAGTTLAVTAAPAVAQAHPQAPTHRHEGVYFYLRRHMDRRFGPLSAGRDIVVDGRADGRFVSDAMVVRSNEVMERALYYVAPRPAVYRPTAAPTYTPTATPTAAATTTSYSSGGCGGDTPYAGGGQCWAIPYSIVQCESGGQNVPNSQGSGANGYYQLMVGGTGSRAQQDAAAHALWNGGAGASNWTCAG